MSEMESLISKEIPAMRNELLKSHINLSEVASCFLNNFYC